MVRIIYTVLKNDIEFHYW